MTATDCRMTRRNILIGAATSLICAPAIARVTSRMPVRGLPLPELTPYGEFLRRSFYRSLDSNLRAGRMRVFCSGEFLSEAEALRMVTYARAQGWLATPAEVFGPSAISSAPAPIPGHFEASRPDIDSSQPGGVLVSNVVQ
jgi:hypothetical protein